MEGGESPFELGRAEDHRWHAERPGESPATDLVLELARRGCLVIVERFDEKSQRLLAVAEITQDGRKRIDELIREGVKPSKGWL